jgi:hypothetical protein
MAVTGAMTMGLTCLHPAAFMGSELSVSICHQEPLMIELTPTTGKPQN